MVIAPAIFVGPFDGPGWTSCVLWAFAAAILRIVDTSQSANCVPCFTIFFSMVATISSVDGEFHVVPPLYAQSALKIGQLCLTNKQTEKSLKHHIAEDWQSLVLPSH